MPGHVPEDKGTSCHSTRKAWITRTQSCNTPPHLKHGISDGDIIILDFFSDSPASGTAVCPSEVNKNGQDVSRSAAREDLSDETHPLGVSACSILYLQTSYNASVGIICPMLVRGAP
jgi:hypothetical protein